jgi:heme A synthase
LSILVVATFVIIVVIISHQRAQRGLGGIRWWLLVRVVTIRRPLLLGLRLHRNYYIFQECRLAPLRRWLRPALLKRDSHMHSSGSAG